MADGKINFGKVSTSAGYDAAALSIVLTTGHGAKLPDPTGANYNLVWWNFTDYADPADDPNVEIVRCTAKTDDTLTVTRAQEGTSATTKNTALATYKMALTVTKKTITDLEASSFAWGASVAGTTADGLTLTLSDSSADGAAALKLVAGNTQASQPVLANLQIGTSANVMGLLIQGTGGGYAAGGAGSGTAHLQIWGDTASNSQIVFAIGNGTSYAGHTIMQASGGLETTGAVKAGVNTYGAFTRSASEILGTSLVVGQAGNVSGNLWNSGKAIIKYGAVMNTAETQTGEGNCLDLTFILETSHASANLTHTRSLLKLATTLTQTAGTLISSGYALDISHNTRIASTRTWAARIVHNNAGASGLACGIDLSSFSVDEPIVKVVADAITTAGAVAGQIAIDIGGTTYYIAYGAHGA